MTQLFVSILNGSITAGWVVLGILLLRLALRKTPKWILCSLWALVGLRLLWPSTLPSAFSLIPSNQVIPPDMTATATPAISSGISLVDRTVNPILTDQVASQEHILDSILSVAGWVWLAGVGIMLLFWLVSWLRLRLRLRVCLCLHDNVYICDSIDTPFVFGLFRPKIYLPSAMDATQHSYVLAHEQAHIRRLDHWWKPVGYLFLSLHWFNPFLWVAYWLLCRDIEQACDDKVIKSMSSDQRRGYSEALLCCSLRSKLISVCPVAFGEVGVKSRIRSIWNYKKPAFWVVIIACVATVAASVCLLTDPLPCDHAYVSAVHRSATCTDTGILTHSCQLCGHSYAEPISLKAHDYDQGIVLTASTCQETGTLLCSCTQCGQQQTKTLAYADHVPGDARHTVPATCVQDGHVSATCTVCSQTLILQTLPKCDTHHLKETVTVPATCGKEGQGLRACTLCDYTEQVVYPKLEHNFEYQFWVSGRCGEYSYEQWACTLCGKTKIVLKERGSHYFFHNGYSGRTTCLFCGMDIRDYNKQPTYIPTN